MKVTPHAALLAAVLLAPAAAAQNLLTNADFEAGLTGWTPFGNAFAESANPPSIAPRSGTQVGKMFGNFSGGFDVTGIFQSFPAIPGQSFTLDAWSRHWDGDPLIGIGPPFENWVVMKMAFFSASNVEIGSAEGTILDGRSPTNTWIDNAPVTGTAPAGTVSVQALILFLQPGNDSGAALIDDVEFTSTLSAPSIRIDSVPPYGSPGSISGTVAGVNFANYRVAVYILIEGSGWWTKPSAANPTVPIQPNGSFTAPVYTCCQDDRATIFYAALIPSGVTPPVASSSCGIPPGLPILAFDHVERFGRTIQFAGRTWGIKESPSPVGPGANLFSNSPNDVFVDAQGRLHLRVVNNGGQWWSSEVVLLDRLGYGTYWFTTESQVGSLDPNLTFGAFTWDSFCDDTTIPQWPNREIDFEDSRWGNAADPTSSQVVVQPYSVNGNLIRYNTPPLSPTPTLTRFFMWRPDRIDFGAVTGLHSLSSASATNFLHTSTYLHNPPLGRRVPPAGREQFRFNLWINSGGAPGNGQAAEVVISDFRYSPSFGTFIGGCGVNPTGSAKVLSGAPTLGTTVTLGFDNPAGTQAAGSPTVLLFGGKAIAGFPCGLPLPNWGMTGPTGEFQLDPALPLISVPGGAWAGAGIPVAFPVAIPFDVSLLNLPFYAQGVLVDPGGAVPLGLTDAIELRIQI